MVQMLIICVEKRDTLRECNHTFRQVGVVLYLCRLIMTICTKVKPSFTIMPLIQVCIFCEGSRFSQEKFEKGVEYAKREGLTPLKYHLVPRTKGYSILAHSLKHDGEYMGHSSVVVGLLLSTGRK